MALSKKEIEKITNDYYDDIYKFCVSRLNNIDSAEDTTQDTFLLFFNKAKELKNYNIRAWLYKTADLKIKELLRKKKIEGSFIPISDCEDIPQEDTYFENINEDEFEKNLTKAQQKILSILNENERQLFIKLYIEKKKVKVVCDEMDITENNLYVKAHRVRKKAKKVLSVVDLLINVLIFKIFL